MEQNVHIYSSVHVFPGFEVDLAQTHFCRDSKKSPDGCKMQANDKGGASPGASMSRIQKISNTPLHPKNTLLNWNTHP